MNAINGLTKVMVCGAVALAVTFGSSWALVESTSVVHWVDMPTVVIMAKADHAGLQLAQSSGTGLLQ